MDKDNINYDRKFGSFYYNSVLISSILKPNNGFPHSTSLFDFHFSQITKTIVHKFIKQGDSKLKTKAETFKDFLLLLC